MSGLHGTDLPGRCTRCGLHPVHQGHRAASDDGTVLTGCANSGPVGLARGMAARQVGIAATNAAHPDDVTRVDTVLKRFIAQRRPFSANDTRPHLTGVKGAVVGGRFQAASRAGAIKRTGKRVPSSDPGTHGHLIDVWTAA